LMPPLGGTEQTLTEATDVWGISWTPDGKWLVVGARDSTREALGIWAISVDTRERRRLTSFPGGSHSSFILGDYYPSVSPDGRTLAFARDTNNCLGGLYVLGLTRELRPDGEPRSVTEQRYGALAGVTWAANGREIVYAAGGAAIQSLWRVSASGEHAPKRLPYALPAAQFPAIARTLPRLAYSWFVNNVNLWRLDVRKQERRMHIGTSYANGSPDYSPDGRKIAFQSNQSGNWEVWSCDADGSACQQLTRFNGPQCGSPRWSPDGKWLALDSRSEGQPEIYVMAADGGQPRRVTNDPASDILPSWSADGLWVYFTSDRSGQYELWKVPKDGGEAVRITRAGGYDSHASLDGRSIYYSKPSQQTLFRTAADGSDEEQVLPAAACHDVTANGIYFFAPGGLAINRLDFTTGKIGTLATLDKPGGCLTVSPDEAFIVWGQTDRATVDLRLVEHFR